MDFLLISPPVANFGQAAPALSVLTAFLRSRGWDAHQWDLSLDAFHHFHSGRHLRTCRAIVQRVADEELARVAGRVARDIDAAKDALREPGITADRERMRWALGTIRDAGLVLTAASAGRCEHDVRTFSVPRAFGSFEAIEAAARDDRANPYVGLFEGAALARLERDRPRAVGLSITYLSQLIPALTLARAVRDRLPDTPIVLGGAYLTATRRDVERVPASVLGADAVVLHDGEEALDGWLRAALGARGTEPRDVPNLYLRDGDRYRRAWSGPVRLTDLDALPQPMWIADGLELDRYLVPRYPIGLPLSRGCYWGRCAYCNISSQTAGAYRRRSVEKSVLDIRAAREETGSSWFDFPVDSFKPKDLRQLARAIVGAGLRIEWGAEVLLDRGFTSEVLRDLARSGCRCLRFGLESASRETLRAMSKPNKPEISRRILGDCREHGIRTAVMLITGFPSETHAAREETFDFLQANGDRIDFLTFHPYSLVPGSVMAGDPGRFGLYLRPEQAVFSPNLAFTNTNPGGLQEEQVPRVIETMRDGLRERYPDLGQLWTVAIGGWMTFPACCADEVRAAERDASARTC